MDQFDNLCAWGILGGEFFLWANSTYQLGNIKSLKIEDSAKAMILFGSTGCIGGATTGFLLNEIARVRLAGFVGGFLGTIILLSVAQVM